VSKELSQQRIEKALEQINESPFHSPNWKQQFTRTETWLFGGLFGSLAACIVSALCFRFGWFPRNVSEFLSLMFLAIAELGFWAMAARNAWVGFRSADQTVTKVNNCSILSDARLILFCEILSTDEIDFLSKRIRLNAEHLRSRIAFLVGPVDKTGAVPLAVGLIWALLKAQDVTQAQKPLVIIVLSGLTLLYLVAMLLTMRSHRIDECAQVLELAVSRNVESDSKLENID
jgi:hypothetical protein